MQARGLYGLLDCWPGFGLMIVAGNVYWVNELNAFFVPAYSDQDQATDFLIDGEVEARVFLAQSAVECSPMRHGECIMAAIRTWAKLPPTSRPRIKLGEATPRCSIKARNWRASV